MKLVLAVVQQEDSAEITKQLLQDGYKVTKLKGIGGFLEESSIVLMIGVEDTHVPKVIGHFKSCCVSRDRYVNAMPFSPLESVPLTYPIKVNVGGAKIFVINVDEYHVL
jgi:uncharacterized protein YaaQ